MGKPTILRFSEISARTWSLNGKLLGMPGSLDFSSTVYKLERIWEHRVRTWFPLRIALGCLFGFLSTFPNLTLDLSSVISRLTIARLCYWIKNFVRRQRKDTLLRMRGILIAITVTTWMGAENFQTRVLYKHNTMVQEYIFHRNRYTGKSIMTWSIEIHIYGAEGGMNSPRELITADYDTLQVLALGPIDPNLHAVLQEATTTEALYPYDIGFLFWTSKFSLLYLQIHSIGEQKKMNTRKQSRNTVTWELDFTWFW